MRTSGISVRMDSRRRTVASVLWMALPCGRLTLTSTSGRSELGKNCFCTRLAIANTLRTSSSKVAATTVLRRRTQVVTSARRRW